MRCLKVCTVRVCAPIVRRLTTLLLDGTENGIPPKKGKGKNAAAVDHKEARNLYRSAILSRFVQVFVVELMTSEEAGET